VVHVAIKGTTSRTHPRVSCFVGGDDLQYDLVLAGTLSVMGAPARAAVREVILALRTGSDPTTTLALGPIELREVDPSWVSSPVLRGLGLGTAPALQIVALDAGHQTIDVPDMRLRWPSSVGQSWALLDPETPVVPARHDCLVDINMAALLGAPVTEVIRWEDGDWQMAADEEDGHETTDEDIRVVHMTVLVDADPSLAEVTDIQPGRSYRRKAADDRWVKWRGWGPDEVVVSPSPVPGADSLSPRRSVPNRPPMDSESYLDEIQAGLDEHGVCIQQVLAGDDEPAFAYTIGLFAAGHSEFLTFGLPTDLAHRLLNDLAYSVLRAGLRYADGDRVHELVKNGFCWLLQTGDAEEYLGVACEIRDRETPSQAGMPVAALQLVLADRNGAWPWEPDSEEMSTPLLGEPPEPGTGTDQFLPEAATRRAQGW
jgi:hypothetical protein